MKKKLLIIDDEKIILESLRHELVHDGYEVTTAENGEEGLAIMKRQYLDLIVTDLMMEGIDGLEVLKAVKEYDPEISVIILTGFGELSTAIEALRLGADDYLLKPCDCKELKLRISKCLEAQEMTRKIKCYESILPLCLECNKVRDLQGKAGDRGKWVDLDKFISEKSGVGISHGYCPDCFEKAMAEIDEIKKGK